MSSRKRYAQVGMGSRSGMYTRAIANDYREHGQMVALCDTNPGRLQRARASHEALAEVATYLAGDFERMVAEQKPDVVVVTTVDSTHDEYIIRAMELGCDVITEKPMTIDAERCRAILDTVDRTGRSLRVTFNYRYAPPRSQVRRMIAEGQIGRILSVDFAWMLDTRHGADYFRRWHGERANSGSLLVHKATHHFDLVNWWLGDRPAEVFCQGSREYYTPAHADELGLGDRGKRCLTCPAAGRCPFYLDLNDSPDMKALYLDNEQHDGYFRDRCVFGERIDIWDTMSASVRYRGGALLNYMLHAYSPHEGYRIAFNGTKGRIEHVACENTYMSGDGTVPGELTKGNVQTTRIREFSAPEAIEVATGEGGHGGGDPKLLDDLFLPEPGEDPLGLRAGETDGAYSILVGVAGCRSIDEGRPVGIDELLGPHAGR